MSMTFVYFIAMAMMGTGVAFLVLILRRNRRYLPKDGVEWAGAILSVLLVASAVFLLVVALRAPSPDAGLDAAGYPEVAMEEAPPLPFRTVADDAPQTLADYEGQVVLLNFWATWCGPCLEELPALNALQEQYRAMGLVVLNVSDEPRDLLLAFEQQLPLKTVSAYLEAGRPVPDPFRSTLSVRPTTYLIDREGRIRDYMMGARTFRQFEQKLLPLLQEAGTAAS